MSPRHQLTLVALLAVAVGAVTASGQDGPVQVRPAPEHPSVVYVLSRARSMADALRWLRPELTRSINADPPATDGPRFDVVCFSPDGIRKLGDALLPPTEANRKRAADFLAKATPSATAGLPKLAPVLSAALAMKPQVIQLVIDGVTDVDRADDWVRTVTKAAGNDQPPVIQVVYVTDTDKGDPATLVAMRKLVGATGGTLVTTREKDH